MRLATGVPSRVAGTKVHRRAAAAAASSRSAPPESATAVSETRPSAPTVTMRTTSACARSPKAEAANTASARSTTTGGVIRGEGCASAVAVAATRDATSPKVKANRHCIAGVKYNDITTNANGSHIAADHFGFQMPNTSYDVRTFPAADVDAASTSNSTAGPPIERQRAQSEADSDRKTMRGAPAVKDRSGVSVGGPCG